VLLRIRVFWDVTLWQMVKNTDVSKQDSVLFFRVRQFNKPFRSKDDGTTSYETLVESYQSAPHKDESTTSYETLVESYQSARRNISEDLSPHLNFCSLLLTIYKPRISDTSTVCAANLTVISLKSNRHVEPVTNAA